MKKVNTTWIKYFILLIIIFILGLVGFLMPYGHAKWNFIFENMMWLPIELCFTIFAINKILELIEERRHHNIFVRIAGEKSIYLAEAIKITVVNIAVNCQAYDKNRDEIKLYDKILMEPTNYFNEKLFSSSREYLLSHNPVEKRTYGYTGILFIHCHSLDTKLKKYIERFAFYFDDDLFKKIADFETLNQKFGSLNYPSIFNDTYEKYTIAPESYDFLQEEAIIYISKAEKLIQVLEKYQKK